MRVDRPRDLTRLVFSCVLVFAVTLLARAEDTSFTSPPPALYKEKLAKLLTPLDVVLKKAAADRNAQGDGNDAIVLLDEEITFVGNDGKRVIVYHTVNKALTDAGVKALAQDSFTYKKKLQRVYLAFAQTIQPDGRRLPVQPDAVFMKTPEDQADDSIYDDESEMVTVFSDVKIGSLTENITVLEDSDARIPNEFSQTYTWNESWPEYLQRWVVDLPKTYADRLKITNLGAPVPDHTTADAGPGRQQLTWEKLNTPGDPQLDSDPPSDQAGPMVWLSTLKDWDAFAAWYASLAQGTDKLGPDLKAKIDAWTKDAKTPADIVRILYTHAALDVRYTAFELGKSDLQPHDCMSVWGRQYGDCKDKANLLRAMLAYKGVPSWLTLLCTEHAGVVNKANPDYRQFDHCILYAQTGDNTFIFCDPTMTYGVPGLLNGDESDRDVLVIKDAKADWVHIPTFHDAVTSYTFDLQLRASGELAGWMDLKGEGYYSAYLQDKYAGLSKDQMQSDLQQDVQDFFPNANVVDVQIPKLPPADPSSSAPAPYTIRAYMVLTGVLNSAETTSELKFPAPSLLLPDTTDYKTRRHATFTWPDRQILSCKIHLPPGWQAPTLPLPLNYQSPALDYTAGWTADKDTLSADSQVQIKQALFPADGFRTLGDAFASLSSWCSKSLPLEKSANSATPATPPPTDTDLAANLPVMPTGEGQLNLIDSEFPDDGNLAARRAALERVPTLFPSDAKSITEAGIKIAILDLDNNKWDDVLKRLQPLVAANRAALDADTIAWAEYLDGLALAGQGQKAEALAIYQKIADNTDVADARRAWAIDQAAEILATTDSPKAALDYADRGLKLNGDDAEPDLFGFYATTAIQNNAADRLKDRLTKLITAKPDNLEDILLQTSTSANDLITAGNKKDGLALVTLLESVSDPATTGDAFARALKKVRDAADATDKYAAIQQALKQALADSPDIAALEKKQPAFASIDDARKSMEQHDTNSEADAALGCCLRILTAYPADANFPDYLWNAAQYSEWGQRQTPTAAKDAFYFKLSGIADQLPHSADKYAEIKVLTGEVLENKGKRADAAAIYTALEKQSDLSDDFIGPVAFYGGNNCAEQGDYAGALAFYKFGETAVDSQSRAQEAVLRAAFINFDDGNQAEALRLVNLLAAAIPKGKLNPSEQVASVAKVGSDTPPAFWSNWQAWWPQWQQLETEAGLEPVKNKLVPIIPSLDDFEKSLGQAKDSKDTAQFFSSMRQLAYAARFYPDAALEFVTTFTTAEQVLPDRMNDFRLLAISILEPMTPDTPKDQRLRYLHLLINYVDSNQAPKAMDLMKTWDGKLEDGGKVCAGIHRVWALAAMSQKQGLDQVAGLLEKDVKGITGADRGLTAGILSDAYVAQGQPQNAVKLLEAEIADPEITANASTLQDLKTRLDNIQKVNETTKRLADGVAVWLKDHQPPWWDYAEPKTPDDPRIAHLADALKQNDGSFSPVELIKAGLLAPSAAALDVDTQEDAVLNSFRTLLAMAPTQTDADALAHSVIDDTTLPDRVRASFLYFFLIDAYTLQKTDSFETFRKLPISASLTTTEKGIVDKLEAFIKVDRSSAATLNLSLAFVTKGPMERIDLAYVEDTVTHLIVLGDIPSAQAIYQASASYTFAPGVTTSHPEMQLRLLRQINVAKNKQPTLDAFRTLALAAHPPDSIAKPAGFDDLRDYQNLGNLPEDQATQIRLYLVKTHRAPPDLHFWYEFMSDLPHSAANTDLCFNLIKAGLTNTTDDEDLAFQVTEANYALDTDDPGVRDKLLALFAPYRDAAKFPQAMESIRLFDAASALRLGKPMNFDIDLGGYTASSNVSRAERYKLRAYLQANDLPKLKAALDALSADDLVSPQLVNETLPALDAAGMQDEAALARDYLTHKLYRDVLECWASPGAHSIDSVTGDIKGLQSAKDIPDAFTAFAQSHIQRARDALAYQIAKGSADQKWDAVAQASQNLVQAYPNYYTFYWPLGRSLAELGRKDEAVKALDIYCKYSLDEAEYPKARDLLAKLAPPKT